MDPQQERPIPKNIYSSSIATSKGRNKKQRSLSESPQQLPKPASYKSSIASSKGEKHSQLSLVSAQQKKIRTNKNQVIFQLKISDELRHLYDIKTKMFLPEMMAQHVTCVTVYEKELDEPLQWYKKTFAFLAGLKTKHEFVVFQLKNGAIGSVDFYLENRVVIRLGNKLTIVQSEENGKRKDSRVVIKNQRPYKIDLSKQTKTELIFEDFIKIIFEITPWNGFSQVNFNGTHFCRFLMRQINKQRNGSGSVIREKLLAPTIGFQLIE